VKPRVLLTLVFDELRARLARTFLLAAGVAIAVVMFLAALGLGQSNSRQLGATVVSAEGLPNTYRITVAGAGPDWDSVVFPQVVRTLASLSHGVLALATLPKNGLLCASGATKDALVARGNLNAFAGHGVNGRLVRIGGGGTQGDCDSWAGPEVVRPLSATLRNIGLDDGDVIVPARLSDRLQLISARSTTVYVVNPRQPAGDSVAHELNAAVTQAIATYTQLTSASDPDVAVQRVDDAGQFDRSQRGSQLIMGAFGATSLFLSSLAIAGAYLSAVGARLHVFGLMRAAGSRPRDLFLLVVIEVLGVVTLGGGLGLIAAFGASGPFNAFVSRTFKVHAQLVSGRAVGLVLLASLCAGLIAGLVPATRAARLDVVRAVESN
jgi:ABC-type antimicrobial peptide transport system permease subunit